MKEHPKDCQGEICDEYTCESRKRALQNHYNSWHRITPESSQIRFVQSRPHAITACLNCTPHQSRSPSSRCGKINQFCKDPYHESVLCIPDYVIPKTWKWAERETEHLGEFEKRKFLFDYHKLKLNFGLCGYPPTPTSQWAPCNTDWQLLRNENTTMHYIGGRTRVTLRVWACSHPNMCCTINVNGMQDGFFNYDNRNLFECEFLDMLLDRVHFKGLSIPEAFHELSNEFEICHDDMPGLPVRTWMAVLESYSIFVKNKSEYASVSQAITRILDSTLSSGSFESRLLNDTTGHICSRSAGVPETNGGSGASPTFHTYNTDLGIDFSSQGEPSNNYKEIAKGTSKPPLFSKRKHSWDSWREGDNRATLKWALPLQLPSMFRESSSGFGSNPTSK